MLSSLLVFLRGFLGLRFGAGVRSRLGAFLRFLVAPVIGPLAPKLGDGADAGILLAGPLDGPGPFGAGGPSDGSSAGPSGAGGPSGSGSSGGPSAAVSSGASSGPGSCGIGTH